MILSRHEWIGTDDDGTKTEKGDKSIMREAKTCEFCDGTGYHCEGDDQGVVNWMQCPGCAGAGAVVMMDVAPPPEDTDSGPPTN